MASQSGEFNLLFQLLTKETWFRKRALDAESTNNWQCKLLMSLWQYFTTANYSWILMEGLYLYNLIFRALFADSGGSIIGYVIMGWGFPFIVVSAWIMGRIFLDDNFCWTTNNSKIYFLTIEMPTLLSVVVNLIFFLRISLVLLNKLKAPLNDDNRKCYMKWAKSTLVLVPLFGVNYVVLFGFQYVSNDVMRLVWYASDSLFGSFQDVKNKVCSFPKEVTLARLKYREIFILCFGFAVGFIRHYLYVRQQGFFVAVLYCFMNGEVKAEVKPILLRMLPFLASHRILGYCFPCKEKFLRSTRGRISVCTTLSCSSYANVLIQGRSNAAKNKEHYCQHLKRISQDAVTYESSRTSINLSNSRKLSSPYRNDNNEDNLEMSNLFNPEMTRDQFD